MLHAVVLAMQATKAAVAAIEPFVASLGCGGYVSPAAGNRKRYFLHISCICVCVTEEFFMVAQGRSARVVGQGRLAKAADRGSSARGALALASFPVAASALAPAPWQQQMQQQMQQEIQ